MIHPTKNRDGKFLYSDRQLLLVLNSLPDKDKAKVLLKAVNFMNENLTTKYMGIAIGLNCSYDEISSLWASEKELSKNR